MTLVVPLLEMLHYGCSGLSNNAVEQGGLSQGMCLPVNAALSVCDRGCAWTHADNAVRNAVKDAVSNAMRNAM